MPLASQGTALLVPQFCLPNLSILSPYLPVHPVHCHRPRQPSGYMSSTHATQKRGNICHPQPCSWHRGIDSDFKDVLTLWLARPARQVVAT